MKKKLEAELISIAHRVLKLKSKSDVKELHAETQKLYEKLSVLLFVEENFADLKPTIGINQMEEKINDAFEKNTIEIEKTENKVEIKDEINLLELEISENENLKNKEQNLNKKEIILEDIPEILVVDPIFEKVEKREIETNNKIEEIVELKVAENKIPEINFFDTIDSQEITFEKVEPKSNNLNELLTKNFNIGLNDKIAFAANLFSGSSEDLNRVISQLNTFDTFHDAKTFIYEMVKPDYNDWKGKQEFEDRFMEIVEKKFS
jgi:hypothetical protein